MRVPFGQNQEKCGQGDEKQHRGDDIKGVHSRQSTAKSFPGLAHRFENLAKFPPRLSESAEEIGQSPGAKKQKDDNQDDENIRSSEI